MEEAYLDLLKHDDDRDGYLTHEQLESYITEFIEALDMPNSPLFQRFYICTILRKMFFFLDASRRGSSLSSSVQG